MLRDSRYGVEQWLDAHARSDDLIGFVFPEQYYPRFAPHLTLEITSIEQLKDVRPPFFVLDADYSRFVEPATPVGHLLAGLRSGAIGYRLVLRFRTPLPGRWLPGAHPDLVGERNGETAFVTSCLYHINPTFEVFERVP